VLVFPCLLSNLPAREILSQGLRLVAADGEIAIAMWVFKALFCLRGLRCFFERRCAHIS